ELAERAGYRSRHGVSGLQQCGPGQPGFPDRAQSGMRKAMHGRARTEAGTLRGWRMLAAAGSVLAVLALGPSADAQDGADAPAETREAAEPAGAQTPARADTPADTPAQSEAPASAPAESPAPPPRAAGDAADDVFVPTEEIAADEEV